MRDESGRKLSKRMRHRLTALLAADPTSSPLPFFFTFMETARNMGRMTMSKLGILLFFFLVNITKLDLYFHIF
jgi:hypothetical protein